jgi:hypothetical protein
MYTKRIQTILTELNLTDNARHVEAFMLLKHSTLNHLSRGRFRNETLLAIAELTYEGAEVGEALAQSYGI